MECNDKQIGRNIKALRNANNINLLDFAVEMQMSDSMLGKIETGERHATDKTIQIISEKTGFSFSDIKYSDISYLEKGELCFEDDLSFDDIVV